jgi:hypothetical protein
MPVAAVKNARITSTVLGGAAADDREAAGAGAGCEAVGGFATFGAAAGAAAALAGAAVAAGAAGVAVAAAAAGEAGAPAAGIRIDGPAAGLGGRLIRTVCFLAAASPGFGGSTAAGTPVGGGGDGGETGAGAADGTGGTGGVGSDISYCISTLKRCRDRVKPFVLGNLIHQGQ